MFTLYILASVAQHQPSSGNPILVTHNCGWNCPIHHQLKIGGVGVEVEV